MNLINSITKEFEFNHHGKAVKQHLKKVYAAMGIALAISAAGGYTHLFLWQLAGLLTMIGAVGLAIALIVTPASADNHNKRLAFFLGFAFLSGINIGPLLDAVIHLNPSIVPTAFLGTSLIFICFSLSALLAKDKKFLFLGGILMSSLSWLVLLGFFNIFFGSQLLFKAQIYIGLVVMCGFILFDTQAIIEKRKLGDEDYLAHCMDLFLDFINIFRYLLIILADKDSKKKRRND